MPKNEGSQKKWRVLIADDHHEARRSTRLMFASMSSVNAEVVAIAADGRQAVEMTKEHRPDIVVLDINMPELDGLTAFKYIHQVYPNTGCIIISAEKDRATLKTADSLGVQEYLIKPFVLEELEGAVQRVIARLESSREKTLRVGSGASEILQLADEYLKTRRTDDQAVNLFEQLAKNPLCDVRWLKTLALIYAIRHEWGKLKHLAERLEREQESKK